MSGTRGRPRCRTGKIRYATSAKAELELQLVRQQRLRDDQLLPDDARIEVRSYPCTKCGGHHLTSEDEVPYRKLRTR